MTHRTRKTHTTRHDTYRVGHVFGHADLAERDELLDDGPAQGAHVPARRQTTVALRVQVAHGRRRPGGDGGR